MIRLYQIGDVRLYHKFFKNQTDIMVNYNVESVSEVTSLIWNSQTIPASGGYSVKRGAMTFKDIAINNERHSMFQRHNLYKSLMYREIVDVFGYFIQGELDGTLNTENYDRVFDGPIMWFHNVGKVKSVSAPNYDNFEIVITMDLIEEFEPINRLLWRNESIKRTRPVQTPSTPLTEDLNPLPDKSAITRLGWIWNRIFYQDILHLYDPDVWAMWHTILPIGHPMTGYGTNLSNDVDYTFHLSNETWSGSTRSLYQWTGLPQTGGVEFAVTCYDGIWSQITYTNSLTLSVLNLQMSEAGYTGLLDTDILVIGNYQGQNSFIIRDGEVLPDIFPEWIYSGYRLGQTGQGTNRIRFTHPNTSVQVAQLHNFRVI